MTTSKEIQQQTQDFLARGGQIQQIPTDQSAGDTWMIWSQQPKPPKTAKPTSTKRALSYEEQQFVDEIFERINMQRGDII